MTLIVGILCKDGVVVGSDGAATLGSLGSQTARQPTKKLCGVGNRIIVGVSGPVGMSQLLVDQVESLNGTNKLSKTQCKSAADAMRTISTEFKKDIIPAAQTAQSVANLVGHQNAATSALCSSVVALPVKGKPTLLQFDYQGAGEAASEDLPFLSVGSEQKTADPFLAFIRRLFWEKRLPKLAEGVFATTWTLKQAIRTSTGGVSDPIQLMVLEADRVRDITSELDDHEANVEALEDHIREFSTEYSKVEPDSMPKPPEP